MPGPRTIILELLKRWHSGDEGALNSILVLELPWLRERVRKRLGPFLRKKGETDDFVQDTVLRFLRYGPRFLISNREHFRALVARMLENALRDEFDRLQAGRREVRKERRLSTDLVLNLDSPRSSELRPSRIAEREERRAWVRLALELLKPEDRQVILLRDFDGLTFPRIAERVGVSEDAARMRYNHALPRLAKRVKKLRAGELAGALGQDS